MSPAAYRALFDRGLARLDAERAHRLGLGLIRAAGSTPPARSVLRAALAPARPALAVDAMGLRFPSPLGLAAGFDKNAVAIDGLAALGFGFVEVGTVTGRGQPGNPRPRLFRLPPDRAVVNRMGFNNDGAATVAARLARRAGRRRPPVVVGVNIGRSRAAGEAGAVDDYRLSATLLAPYADYLVVNVSSPNTPGLRDLQAPRRLAPLLAAVRGAADAAAGRRVPLLVKISPDLADDDLLAVADLVAETGVDGIIACNTTVRRDGLRSGPAQVHAAGPGGLSGPPLRGRAMEVLALVRERLGSGPVVVSVGGVSDAGDVAARLRAGATLVQAYTAFVYQGPWWAARVNRELATALAPERPAARCGAGEGGAR